MRKSCENHAKPCESIWAPILEPSGGRSRELWLSLLSSVSPSCTYHRNHARREKREENKRIKRRKKEEENKSRETKRRREKKKRNVARRANGHISQSCHANAMRKPCENHAKHRRRHSWTTALNHSWNLTSIQPKEKRPEQSRAERKKKKSMAGQRRFTNIGRQVGKQKCNIMQGFPSE